VQGKRNEIALQMLINGILVTDEDVRGNAASIASLPTGRQARGTCPALSARNADEREGSTTLENSKV